MKRFLVVVALGACSAEEPVAESVVETALTEYQGSEYQGSEYQGSEYQGSEYQGSEYQGSEYQGSEYQGATFDSASISGTSLVTWKKLPGGDWEQRTANQLCRWNSTRTSVRAPCTVYDLKVSASPVAGTSWPAKFTKVVNGIETTVTGTIRIGIDDDHVGAVSNDISIAMHPLEGTSAQSCALQTCSNPRKCRTNCDLFTYELWLITDTGEQLPFCPGGGRAYALSGTWSKNGTRSLGSQFTFACPTGTIAKCTRWGYRPFGSAIKSDGTSASLAEYHQACVRAAAADYCSNGHSFTKNGTLVDIYDYGFDGYHSTPNYGFVPNVSATTAFVWESEFDKYGARFMDHHRYEELTDTEIYSSIDDQCGGRFAHASEEFSKYIRTSDCGGTTPCGPFTSAATVHVRASTSCAHSEQTVGDALHKRCNIGCTDRVRDVLPHCTDALSSEGWNQACVDKAAQLCQVGTSTAPMATHSECTTGGPLNKLDSACTFAVCSENSWCCVPYVGSWSQSCVDLANSKCTGGRESVLHRSGFCTGWEFPNPFPVPTSSSSG